LSLFSPKRDIGLQLLLRLCKSDSAFGTVLNHFMRFSEFFRIFLWC